MLQYWGMSSLSLFYPGAHSQLFRTDTHVLFNSTKHGSFLPAKVCQLRVEKEEAIMSNHMCPQMRRPEVFQPHFLQPIPSTAF